MLTADHDFVAIDGEGLTRHGSHDYVLLAASDGHYIEDYGPGGLDSARCFEFLLDLSARHPGAVFCVFGGSYDFQMWLRQAAAPTNTAKVLVPGSDRNWRALLAERYFTWAQPGRRYKLQAIMRHAFYTANGAYVGGAWRKDRSLKVWDVIGWFQSSFVDAIDHWQVGRAGERAHIRAMKEGRATFTPKQKVQVRRYCLRECDLLVDLMYRLDETLQQVGIRPARWDGAGAGAAALFRHPPAKAEPINRFIARPADAELVHAIDCAYIGGRVQQFVSGVVPGPTYTYDLQGAYPHAMMGLPCLAHGHWQRHDPALAPRTDTIQLGRSVSVPLKGLGRKLDRVISKWSLFRVHWSCPPGQRLTPLPVRHEQGIYWPREGTGWYWSEEVAAAVECGYAITLLDRWSFDPGCDHEPFGWLRDFYAQRLAMKVGGDPGERVIKLVANAGYGKLVQAQREGRPKLPAFQSYVWGGMITADVRAKVLRLASRCDELVAIQTDGVFSATPIPELLDDVSRETVWERGTVEPGLLVIQPGVMLGPSARFVRSRGFDRGAISYRRAVAAWRRHGFEASIKVADRRFVSADWAEFSGHPEWWLRWREIPRELSFAVTPRQWPRPGKVDPAPEGSYELLYPPEGFEGMSAPYHARVREPASEDSAYEAMVLQQPDVVIDSGRV